jgi:serine/threonine-protein kinase
MPGGFAGATRTGGGFLSSLSGWDIPIGTEIAGYRISGVIGRGGMSVVYAAEHVGLGRTVALKLLSATLAADPSFRERFTRESRLAATLDHPNITQVYDAGEADGFLYIAMRHVDGVDLGTLIERSGPLPLGQTVFYMDQIAGALDQAHAQGLIHRDVKPANILIARNSDRAFLTDFGVVKQASSQGLTKTGFFLGTFEYAAPEQIEGRSVDGRTDVYALGCVLYQCLSGEPPFKAATEGTVIHAHLVEPPPKLSAKRPDLPVGINEVIATAMAKGMDDRYRSGGEFAKALRSAALGTTTEERRVVPPTVQAPVTPTDAATVTPAGAATVAPAAAATTMAPHAGGGGGEGGGEPPASGPPSDPGSPSKQPRTVTLSTGRMLAIAAAVVALIAAAVILAVVLAGNDNTSNAQAGTGATTQGTTTAAPAAAVGLAGVVPNEIYKYCTEVAPSQGAALAATCRPPSSGSTFYPNSWEISLFANSAALNKAYNTLRKDHKVRQDFGRCSGITWGGEYAWKHGPDKPGGREFCYFDGDFAVIVWTHEKLGQASHIDMLGVARASGSDHSNLYNWFRFWHHRIGKCPAPDCTAKLQ